MPIKPVLPDPPKSPIHIPDGPKPILPDPPKPGVTPPIHKPEPEHPIAKAIVEDKIESRALSARQQAILDAVRLQETAIRALFLNYGMDSMSANKGWIELLVIFGDTPTHVG